MNFFESVREEDRSECFPCNGSGEELGMFEPTTCYHCAGLGWTPPTSEDLIEKIMQKGEISIKITRWGNLLWQANNISGESLQEALYRLFVDMGG